MRLKLDENLSQRLKDILAPHAHDVDTVAEEGLASQP
jgi:predicted nuclease of predicted toxin-antitoxin system